MEFDILSDVLQSVRLSGAIFFQLDVSSPWVAAAPPSREIAASVIPDAEHMIEYHVVVSGMCWARIAGAETEKPIPLAPGSIIAFPQGDAHVLASTPELDAEPDFHNVEVAARAQTLPIRIDKRGGGAETAQLICGFLGCDIAPFNPLIASLPRIIHIPDGYGRDGDLLGHLIRATVQEADNKGAGSRGVLAKLSELIFIEVIRRYAETATGNADGWLASLKDPGIGRALRLLHADPARQWTVAKLARAAGLSRTVLAERFTELLGMPPMTYLANWRMQQAAAMLAAGHTSLSRVAIEVGYESDVAFSRAFKRNTGLSPSEWRKSKISLNR